MRIEHGSRAKGVRLPTDENERGHRVATRPMSGMRPVYVLERIQTCMRRLLCAVPIQSAAMKPPLHKIVRQAL